MKKIFTLIAIYSSLVGFGQSSIEVKDMATLNNVPANGTVNLIATAGNQTSRTFDLKNVSANTNTYIVIRYDAVLNSGATAYYCFAGTCYGNTTFISPNPLVLTAGQSASDYTTAYTTLTTDLDEGPTAGQSIVKYTFRNANDVNDSLQFTLYYNNPTANINENNGVFTSTLLFPNPTKSNSTLQVNSTFAGNSTLSIYDINGKLISQRPKDLVIGKNMVTIQSNELPKGTYFVELKNELGIIKEKLIIE
ncbi:MAG: T9SS type A sorting domain-containing protein [Bacteroidia bacterium]